MSPANEPGPERLHVGDRRVRTAVADAAHRQVQHVAANAPVSVDVALCHGAGELVGPREVRVEHSRSTEDALDHEIVIRHAARPLGEDGEHDVGTVVVGEPRAGRERRRMAVQDGEVVLGRRQVVHRHGHHVLGHIRMQLLVEVVADARAVCQQLLDRHVLRDQRQIGAEERPRCRSELDRSLLR